MKQLAIEAENITLQKEGDLILNNLNIQIEKGIITGLIGPSGAGKTSLMRVILGIQQVKSKVKVLGKNAGSKKLRSKIGYVSQQPSVYGDLSVEQNLSYFARLLNSPKSQVKKIIQQVDLEPQSKQLVSTLSGGQRARVSLAIALLGNPELLVLDEPTVGLDPILRRDLWGLFSDLAKSGKTLLVSSHVMNEAERCQRLLLLRDGQVLWQGEKSALLSKLKVSDVEDAFLQLASKKEKAI